MMMLRRKNSAFTFIELIVAISLTMLLLEGMYSMFFSATNLVRMSEESAEIGYEISAMQQVCSEDFSRSPAWTTNYYLSISSDQRSITFQISGLDGGEPIYVEYSMCNASGGYSTTDRTGTKLLRTVWRTRGKTERTTEATDGEDGSTVMVVQNITSESMEIDYFDDDYRDINGDSSITSEAAWISSPTLDGSSRTRAVRFKFTISSTSNTIQSRRYDIVVPINY